MEPFIFIIFIIIIILFLLLFIFLLFIYLINLFLSISKWIKLCCKSTQFLLKRKVGTVFYTSPLIRYNMMMVRWLNHYTTVASIGNPL